MKILNEFKVNQRIWHNGAKSMGHDCVPRNTVTTALTRCELYRRLHSLCGLIRGHIPRRLRAMYPSRSCFLAHHHSVSLCNKIYRFSRVYVWKTSIQFTEKQFLHILSLAVLPAFTRCSHIQSVVQINAARLGCRIEICARVLAHQQRCRQSSCSPSFILLKHSDTHGLQLQQGHKVGR